MLAAIAACGLTFEGRHGAREHGHVRGFLGVGALHTANLRPALHGPCVGVGGRNVIGGGP